MKHSHHQEYKPIRDIIFGFNDGLVSTLALVAGLTGALLTNKVIVIAGLAEVAAGAISMGLGAYISSKSQQEYYTTQIKTERYAISKYPDMERKEIEKIYMKKGLRGKELKEIVDTITANKKRWLNTTLQEGLGLTGLSKYNPKRIAIIFFLSFIIGAVIPLFPFTAFSVLTSFKIAIVSSVIAVFIVGAVKTYYTKRNWFKSGIEMVMIAGIATIAAFYIGQLIGSLY